MEAWAKSNSSFFSWAKIHESITCKARDGMLVKLTAGSTYRLRFFHSILPKVLGLILGFQWVWMKRWTGGAKRWNLSSHCAIYLFIYLFLDFCWEI